MHQGGRAPPAATGDHLGPADHAKVDDYLESIRDVERRIRKAEEQSAVSPTNVTQPAGIPDGFDAHVQLLYDLQVLAYQADITRVVTMLMGRETSPRTFEQIGVPEQHHSCSHHIDNPELMARKAKIDQYHVALFGQFLEKLKATPDGDGTLLDHSMILYGGGLGNGNLHDHVNLPVFVAGRGAGTLSGGFAAAERQKISVWRDFVLPSHPFQTTSENY